MSGCHNLRTLIIRYLWAPKIVAVVIKARVDFKVCVGRFKVTCEWLEIIKLLLEVGAE